MPRVPGLPKLLGLWRGDEDSMGYVFEPLAREIARKLKPKTELELFQQLYPGCELADVDKDAQETVAMAFRRWREDLNRASDGA